MELFSESRGVPLCGTLLYSVVKKIRQRWDLRFVIRDLRFEIGGIGELGNRGIGESVIGNRKSRVHPFTRLSAEVRKDEGGSTRPPFTSR